MLDLESWVEITIGEKIAIIVSIVFLATLIASVIAGYFTAKKTGSKALTARDLAYGGICLGLSFALGFIGIHMPQGGTITLASSLPVMIYCHYFGFRKSLPVCIANMFLQFLQEPYIVHPMSAVMDYVIPYLALIFFGVFSYKAKKAEETKKEGKITLSAHTGFFLAAGIYAAVRYTSHVLSGGIFYSEYAWEGWAVWPYSFAYNAFFLADFAVAVIAGCFLLSSQAFNRLMAKSANTLQNSDTAQEHNQ